MKPIILLAALAALALAACQSALTPAADLSAESRSTHGPKHDHSSHSHVDKPATNSRTVAKSPATPGIKPYPLSTCVVTDEGLNEWEELTTYLHGDQEMKFCCKMCLRKFKKNPEKYLAKLPQG